MYLPYPPLSTVLVLRRQRKANARRKIELLGVAQALRHACLRSRQDGHGSDGLRERRVHHRLTALSGITTAPFTVAPF